MDRASEFLRQQFRLKPAKRGPSIQSPKHSGTWPAVPETQLQEEGMPHAVVAPTAEKAVPDVGMAPADEENSDAEWSLEAFAKEDYRSDEDRCRDYLRTMKSAVKKGHDVAIQALTQRREWHLIRAYIRGICPRRFQTCFIDRGWPATKTAEMLADWATEPELGPSDTPMMKLAHEIVGLYKDVYYGRRRAEANKVAAERSLAAESEARQKLATDLADQQVAWAAERAALLADLAAAVQERDVAKQGTEAAVRDKDAAEHEMQSARTQAMDAALLLKEAVEVNSQIQTDLRIRIEQVYELRRQQHTSRTPPSL